MEKRFIFFIVLSFLIMAGWQLVITKIYPPKKPAEVAKQAPQQPPAGDQPAGGQPAEIGSSTGTPQTTPAPTPTPTEQATQPSVAVTSAPARRITVETQLWRGVFDSQGGVIKSLNIHHLPTGREILAGDYGPMELVSKVGLEKVGAPMRLQVEQNPDLTKKLNESTYNVDAAEDTITLGPGEQRDIVFSLQDGSGLTVQKRYRFYGGQYLFDVTVDGTLNGQPLQPSIFIGPNFGDQSVKSIDSYINTPQQAVVEYQNDDVEFLSGQALEHRSAPPDKIRVFNNDVNWTAETDHYFAMAVVPPTPLTKAAVHNDYYSEKVDGEDKYQHLLSIEVPVINGQTYNVFLGPKDRNIFYTVNQKLNGRVDLEDMIDYGIFSFMVKPLMPLLEIMLKVFYNITGNYGWAIIILTFIINMFFFPLKWKSSVAMKKAVKLQPKIKELQEKMKGLKKDDPKAQQIQLELMKLMREGNPLAGCLPMLLQMPFFWAFFIFLSISISVRHSPFIFWIKDLSAFDPTYILPIIMTVSMMASTALTPTPNDPAQRMQKIMTSYLMPVIFLLLFFKNAPSGLVLYWMFGNLVGIAQQLIINKMTTEPAPPADPKASDNDNKGKKRSDDDKNRTKTGDLANV